MLALLGAMLAVVSAYSTSIWWNGTGVFVAILSVCAALVLNVVPFGEWELRHAKFFTRWTDIREDIETTKFMSQEHRAAAVERIEARMHRLCGAEPKPNQEKLRFFEEQTAASMDVYQPLVESDPPNPPTRKREKAKKRKASA